MKHVKVTIKSIPMDDALVLVTSDASWANCQDLSSQAGYMILFSQKDVAQDKWSDVSPLRWKSWKLDRKTQSTLAAELMAVSRAIAEGDWVRSLFAEFTQVGYRLCDDRQARQQLEMLVVTDNKPVFDHCQGDGGTIKGKRTAIDMLLIKAELRSQQMTMRWVDTRQMIVDCLTKLSANPDFLCFVLRFGVYVVVQEGVSLQWKAQERLQKKMASPSSKGYVKGHANGEAM